MHKYPFNQHSQLPYAQYFLGLKRKMVYKTDYIENFCKVHVTSSMMIGSLDQLRNNSQDRNLGKMTEINIRL